MINATRNESTGRSFPATEERGVATTEYAIMLFLVSLTVLGFGDDVSGAITGIFEQVVTLLT